MAQQIKLKKSDPPESKEVLADAVVNIGKATKKLLSSGMNEKAIIVLIHDYTKLPKSTIKTVLHSLPQLERWYCK